MNRTEILSLCDHTLLRQDATQAEILSLCDEGIRYATASVCIPPCFVRAAKEYTGGRLPVCTVVGFPNGYNEPIIKAFETSLAVKNGADEIDTVINVGDLKMNRCGAIADELARIKDACEERILKVIIETCLLTDEEKKKMCEIISGSDADYIKTSTGFSTAGATVGDIELFKKYLAPEKKIKAAGGIRSFEAAEAMIAAGASRIGASALVKIAAKEGL